mmetsp:Transcript_24778/g.65041  ORF Transcript_24778/g.65041 Transcript_24778/m.65041 type:complete len:223 (+) Transcript_24778:1173-1841(+)
MCSVSCTSLSCSSFRFAQNVRDFVLPCRPGNTLRSCGIRTFNACDLPQMMLQLNCRFLACLRGAQLADLIAVDVICAFSVLNDPFNILEILAEYAQGHLEVLRSLRHIKLHQPCCACCHVFLLHVDGGLEVTVQLNVPQLLQRVPKFLAVEQTLYLEFLPNVIRGEHQQCLPVDLILSKCGPDLAVCETLSHEPNLHVCFTPRGSMIAKSRAHAGTTDLLKR